MTKIKTPHVERHFTASASVRDIVIGMADGLTVPFALAAGLSGAISKNHIVVTAGLAEIAAGSIAMGLGGFLAARGDAEHYASELEREQTEVVEKPEAERQEVLAVFRSYGLTMEESIPIVDALSRRPADYVDFMMRFELGLEEPEPKRALTSAVTIAAAYIVGGLVPLLPYMLASNIHTALRLSVIATLCALAIFGYIKAYFTGSSGPRSALHTVVVGGLAAAAAFAIAKAIS